MSTDKSITSAISSRIAQVIAEAGESQRQVAARVGVSQGFISNVVTGSSQPSVTLLAGLCRCYQISGDWLLNGEGPIHKPVNEAGASPNSKPVVEPPLVMLVRQAMELDERDIEHLETYMRGFMAARERSPQRARAG